ncbi:hypothetical protein ACWGLF_20435 [Streptomyces puniciscabiei]
MTGSCGQYHPELPMGHSTMAPDVWDQRFADAPDSMLSPTPVPARPEAPQQRTGITEDRVREIAEAVLDPDRGDVSAADARSP